jgi:hypothetical protein
MKKVVKKAAMGSNVSPKPKPKAKAKAKEKTVDRGMLPNVTVKSIPEFAPMSMEKWRNELNRDVQEMMKKDSTSKMKMGGKVAKMAKKVAPKMMKKISKKK